MESAPEYFVSIGTTSSPALGVGTPLPSLYLSTCMHTYYSKRRQDSLLEMAKMAAGTAQIAPTNAPEGFFSTQKSPFLPPFTSSSSSSQGYGRRNPGVRIRRRLSTIPALLEKGEKSSPFLSSALAGDVISARPGQEAFFVRRRPKTLWGKIIGREKMGRPGIERRF